MESSHVTDDVSAPDVCDYYDDDVNNPFYEAPSTPPTPANSASSPLAKFRPGTVSESHNEQYMQHIHLTTRSNTRG